ncbi:Adenosine 3'-phospho 5'-phosphosulfate transporter 1 (PAPS transporter 1) (Solute carrier family 35 member B2) [Durusdinium trenchii]|uniref:Adenosine 3'-phospho 5'-phosphosulfate transporter 1 (PAPS transporter 1) (Solute carrier family 35 member B2) n=1 Tax=Durusdinium trenchii TaxID=1381693 RepID=A0ABP0MW20_9DINO
MSDEEPPTALLFTLMTLAEHFDFMGETHKALEYGNEAIEHTPTLVELYACKARIYKHAGDLETSAKCYEEVREMDLADRYLNTQCVRALLRIDETQQGMEKALLFSKEPDSQEAANLHEMQCMWYESAATGPQTGTLGGAGWVLGVRRRDRSELEVGRSYYRQKKYGKALKQPGRLGGTGAELANAKHGLGGIFQGNGVLASWVGRHWSLHIRRCRAQRHNGSSLDAETADEECATSTSPEAMKPMKPQKSSCPAFSKERTIQEWAAFLHYGLGILVTIGAYSFLQERIVSKDYDGEIFKATMFLVLCNRLVSIVYALFMITCKGESWRKQATLWKYVVVSFSNMLSTWCQYESLRYVSLILQTVAKTFKMLPVMLVGILISKKRHSLTEVVVVACLTLGLCLFVAGGDVRSSLGRRAFLAVCSENAEGSSIYGICLLAAFLGFDSFTSNFQEKLFKEDNMSKYNQMLYMNLSSAIVATSILLATGRFPYCASFVAVHSGFAGHVLTLSLSAAAGQFYIFSMVQRFGALALAAAMNARQVTTIFLSYLTQTQPLTWVQRVGLIILCLALAFKASRSFVFFQNHEKELNGSDPPRNDLENDVPDGNAEDETNPLVGGKAKSLELVQVVGDMVALGRFHETFKHFSDIAEDQFDFHNYCLRKTTLKAYVSMLRMQERLYSHKFYRRAAKDAVKIYLELYDAKVSGCDWFSRWGFQGRRRK